MKPNPLTAVDYVDDLIMKETEEEAPGWKDRVERLKEVRKEAEKMPSLPEDNEPKDDPIEPIPEIDVKPDSKKEEGIFDYVKLIWGKVF